MPTRTSPRKFAAAGLLTLAALTGPLSVSHAIFDKTRFAAHLGAGYFAFHHWVLTPYRTGHLASGAQGRTGSLVKGGLALLFAAHEVKVAENIAHKSNDPLLQKLDAGLSKLTGSFTSVGQSLKSGQLNTADIDRLNSDTSALSSTAAAAGQPIKDVPVSVPGL